MNVIIIKQQVSSAYILLQYTEIETKTKIYKFVCNFSMTKMWTPVIHLLLILIYKRNKHT